MVAALLVPGSDVTVANVGLNPLRTGLFTTLQEMGAELGYTNRREAGGEAVADIVVRHAPLRGVTVPPERAPSMIDEYPILFAAAACAEGDTVVRGARELRVKESDRLGLMARGLKACGVDLDEFEDGLVIRGKGRTPQGGVSIANELDPRIAMSFLVLGLAETDGIAITDARVMDTRFTGFHGLLQG